MFSVKRRVLTAASFILAATMLAGCAVPGQGDPGIAAQGDGVSVSLSTVDEYAKGLTDIGIVDQADWALTLALVHDAAIEKSAELGGAWSDDEVTADIAGWLEAIGYADGIASPQAVEVVRTAKALGKLATTEEGAIFLNDLAGTFEAELIASPRFGDFSAATFLTAMATAADSANSNYATYGEVVYVVFVAVTGFTDAGASPDWFGETEDAFATAAPEPASTEDSGSTPSATAGE